MAGKAPGGLERQGSTAGWLAGTCTLPTVLPFKFKCNCDNNCYGPLQGLALAMAVDFFFLI